MAPHLHNARLPRLGMGLLVLFLSAFLPLAATAWSPDMADPDSHNDDHTYETSDEVEPTESTLPAADCGVAGDERATPSHGFAGYWQTTNGYMRLVQVGPGMVEGPSSASSYFKGHESGNTLSGRFADDTGRFHPGRFSFTRSQDGRCLSGTFIYDGDEDINEVKGFHREYDGVPYTEHYALTERTEHLKQMVGGTVPFSALDTPNP